MEKVDFSVLAEKYEEMAFAQKTAAEILLSLMDLKGYEDVLDLGCGTGMLTRRIREMTSGRVVGIDPSLGMIKEAIEKSRGFNIIYEVKSAEEMDYDEEFDVIICNSVMQWFRDPDKALENCYRALRPGGRIGVQATAKKIYCPNFVEAVERVRKDERTRSVFAHFREPWFFLESEEEYVLFFERHGFKVVFSDMRALTSEHTPDEVFKIFSSGAMAGYLNQDYYDVPLTEDYISAFNEIVKEEFRKQAGSDGKVKLTFNRVFIIAVK
ncbi:MAG: methyltransferase domain-containing protein [Candidatus Jordarchaeales archaeon]